MKSEKITVVENNENNVSIQVQQRHRNKKTKRDDSSDEAILSQALQVLKQPDPDDMDIFGQYIASELRGLENAEIRREVKHDITLLLLKAQQKELARSQSHLQSTSPSPFSFEQPPSVTWQF